MLDMQAGCPGFSGVAMNTDQVPQMTQVGSF